MKGVSVIGAGVAGLIAAKALSSNGISTRVYEQKVKIGVPVRASGIVSIPGLASLGIGCNKAITNTLYGARIHANGTTMHIKSSKPQARVLERRALNEICRDEAVDSGAMVTTGHRVSPASLKHLVGSSVIIGADGAASTVASTFNMGSIDSYVLTYRAEYEMNVADSENVDLYFDRGVTPGFFAWIAPESKDRIEVAVGLDSKFGNSKMVFDKFVQQREVQLVIDGAKHISSFASMIPIGLRKRVVDEANGVVLVGDAAGQVKHSTGGGLVFGGNGALLAADAVKNHIERGAKLSAYEKAWKKKFGTNVKLHSLIKKMYSKLEVQDFGGLIRLLNRTGIADFLGSYGDMDMPSKMIKRIFVRKPND